MNSIAWLLTGGFAKGYRTQILGLVTAISALASCAVGEATLAELVAKAPVIFGGLGLAALGVKVEDAKVLNRPG
jgi:putative Mn2+ efflux pump MntP